MICFFCAWKYTHGKTSHSQKNFNYSVGGLDTHRKIMFTHSKIDIILSVFLKTHRKNIHTHRKIETTTRIWGSRSHFGVRALRFGVGALSRNENTLMNKKKQKTPNPNLLPAAPNTDTPAPNSATRPLAARHARAPPAPPPPPQRRTPRCRCSARPAAAHAPPPPRHTPSRRRSARPAAAPPQDLRNHAVGRFSVSRSSSPLDPRLSKLPASHCH